MHLFTGTFRLLRFNYQPGIGLNFFFFFIICFQVVAALSVSLGSMVVGFSCSYTSPALVSMKNNATATFEVTTEMVSNLFIFFFFFNYASVSFFFLEMIKSIRIVRENIIRIFTWLGNGANRRYAVRYLAGIGFQCERSIGDLTNLTPQMRRRIVVRGGFRSLLNRRTGDRTNVVRCELRDTSRGGDTPIWHRHRDSVARAGFALYLSFTDLRFALCYFII